MIMNPSRATLRTRPRIQRALIRSWEYIQPVRVTFLVIRLLVVLWLIVLSGILLSAGIGWGWTLLPAAVAVLALSVWVFTTAGKGWPVVDA
jgi:predicted anti-sigma-YlaC factor YlaD